MNKESQPKNQKKESMNSNISKYNYKYILNEDTNKDTGIIVKTIGSQTLEQNYNTYPPNIGHPDDFLFNPSKGRVLSMYVLLYLAKGEGQFFRNQNDSIAVKEGDVILIRPNVWHSYRPDKLTGWKEYWIAFQSNYPDNLLETLFNKRANIYHIGIQDKILYLFEDAIRIANEEKPGYQQYISGVSNLILCMVNYYEKNRISNPITEDIINKAKRIIKRNITRRISPEEVANEISLSYSWFRKTFKEYTGITPSQYIKQIATQEAKILLTTSHNQIKEIAYQLGFEDVAYFISYFKRYVGLSPSEYRKLYYESKKE